MSDVRMNKIQELNEQLSKINEALATIEAQKKNREQDLSELMEQAHQKFGVSSIDELRALAVEEQKRLDEKIRKLDEEIELVGQIIQDAKAECPNPGF